MRAPPPATPLESPQPVPVPTVVPGPLLQRADLIELVARAADAASDDVALEETLAGRRFVVRIPFGCGTQTRTRNLAYGWSYDVDEEALRVSIVPQDWATIPWVLAEMERRGAETAEGFWIPRPWTRSETCPSGHGDPSDPSSSLGIAQIFAPDSSRVGQRRGRAMEATVRLPSGEILPEKGLRLVLEGRIARWPQGRESVLCDASVAYDRPVCLIAASFDVIAVENAANGARLADWRF